MQGTRNSVSPVETMRPPTAALARGAEASEPSPSFIAIGIRPATVASAVIRIGRILILADSSAACLNSCPWRRRSLAKSTSKIEFETTIPTITMIPMNDSMFSVVPVNHSVQMTPINPIGTANMMISGSRKRTELRDHHQVKKDHCQKEAESKAGEGFLHRGYCPAILHRDTRRQSHLAHLHPGFSPEYRPDLQC